MPTYTGIFHQGRHKVAAPEWNIRPASDEVVERSIHLEPALILRSGRKDTPLPLLQIFKMEPMKRPNACVPSRRAGTQDGMRMETP